MTAWRICVQGVRMVVAVGFAALAFAAGAQEPVRQQGEKAVISEPRIVERGPHHRVIERTVAETLPDGRTVERKSSYTELATGLHYLNDRGEWIESREEIEIFQGGAAARQGQHKVIFAANLNSAGAIDLLAPDGQRFRSHILGLFYTDYASGRSVMIAEVKDSTGAVLPPNQVIYQDAFAGDCVADVRLTYTKFGFEQDIILVTAPPSPSEWGLNPETTRLEVFTEFIEAPPVRVTSVMLKAEEDPIARQFMKEPDLIDQRLDFGGMTIGPGQAFPLGEAADAFSESSIPTGKSLEVIDGRVILIEKVDYPAVRVHLGRLPKSASLNPNRKVGLFEPGRTMMASLLPTRPGVTSEKWRTGQYAKVDANRKGFVLDYVSMSASSLTNYVLRGDRTYFITNGAAVNFYGTTVLESGAVIKHSANSYLYFNGPLDCRTDAYRPAIVTSKDDDTVGDPIASSTGSPSGYYGAIPFGLKDTSAIYTPHDLHMRYCTYGFNVYADVRADFSNIQVGNSGRGVAWLTRAATTWRNFLFHDLGNYGFQANGSGTNRAEHGTMHRLAALINATNSTQFLFLTNSLLISVTNNHFYLGASNATNQSDAGIFQTVGAATHYLASGSTNRDAGTTNINPDLLAALKSRTTYPPVVYSNVTLTTNLTLALQPIRDTNAPDLGYSYAALDFVLGDVRVTNSTLTLSAGVAVGTFTPWQYGIGLLGGAQLVSEGTPTSLNRIVRYNMVQEQATTSWNGNATGGASVMTKWQSSGATPDARFRFTEWSVPSGSYHFWGMMDDDGAHDFVDCQFHSGMFVTDRPSVTLTNSLINRTLLGLYENYDFNVHVRNCTFVGNDLDFYHVGTGTWTFKDNLFDATTILYQEGAITHDYNAYTTNATRLATNGTHDLVLTVTNITYDTGRLGHFYLPTNLSSQSVLFDRGSTNASAVGLFHYTTTTNQVKDGNSTNDLGFHYVALNSSEQPVDSDGDGLADYIEDVNGNGLTDGSENSAINPVLTLVSTMDYIKGGPAKRFDTNAVAYDSDAVNFNGGQFKIRITAGAEANDLLSIRHEGTGATQIGATTNTISYGGTNIATYTGGTGTNALVISFNTNAINTSVQALARNLTFQSISNAPASSNRVVSFELTDGRGGTNAPTSLTINLICPDAIDAFVVIDISQSLTPSEFSDAKQAASNFVTHLNFSTDRVGLVSFAGYANFDSPLTNNGSVVQSKILSLIDTNGTRFHPAFDLARTNMTQTASNVLPIILLLSDGRVGTASGSGTSQEKETNRVLALEAAIAVKDAGIRLITVAYGTNGGVNDGTNLMKTFASSPNDAYYAPTIAEINTNFSSIADGICRGYSLVAITNPTNNAVFVGPTNITITASASDSEGIAKVEFYNFGTTKLGEDASSPYSIDWTNPTVGTNQLTARAIDTLGISTTSAVVNVIVRSPPSISLVAPTNSTHFASVMNLLVRAAATDVDGYITNVQFFTNNVLAVNVTNPPFQFAWTNLSNNTFSVYAVAKDNDDYTGTSLTNTFNVDACPQVGLKSFLLSTNNVVGGFSVTGTVILSNAAPAGGQAVVLQCADPNVSIPASVLVAAEGTSNTFTIHTFNLASGGTPSITAVTPLKSISTNLTLQSAGFQSARYSGQCGPMDVVFLIDRSASMGSAIDGLKSTVTQSVDSIEFASGGDYRLALVSFDSNINVHVAFTLTNRAAFIDGLTNVNIVSGDVDEPSDEALNMVINNLSSAGRPRQVGDFTNGFRFEARRIVILITDEPPFGFTGTLFDFEEGVDDVNAHRQAVSAALKNIQICSLISAQLGGNDDFPTQFQTNAVLVGQDYAAVSGGIYIPLFRLRDSNDVHLAVQTVMSQCGADAGELIITRDDLQQSGSASLVVNEETQFDTALSPAAFDLSGIDGPVMATHLQRSGQLRINHGSHFDFSLGVSSIASADLASFAPTTRSAHSNALAFSYMTNWHLPFSFYADIQNQLDGIYSLQLVDRASAACGSNFEIVDAPQAEWPVFRNVLAIKTLARFEIAQGRCRDFVLTGTNAPCGEVYSVCSGSWEIRLYDSVIASECAPHGWSVEPDHGVYGGVNICAPIDAVTANRYEARFNDGTNSRSGYFSVVSSNAQNGAPVLKPIELSAPLCSSNTAVTVTVSLDAPAQGNGAYVAVTCVGITNQGIPSYVHIAPGASLAAFTFRPNAVAETTAFTLVANYNGERHATGQVVLETTPVDMPENVVAQGDSRKIVVSWSSVPQATSYAVWRTDSQFFSDAELLASGLTRTCFVDEHPLEGERCYFVEAVNASGSTVSETDMNALNCETYTPGGVLRPRIIPHGGRFNDFAVFTITNENQDAIVYFRTDGIVPTPTDGISWILNEYTMPFQLSDSGQVIAKAFRTNAQGQVIAESPDDRADFHISQPTPLGCGSNVTSMLATTNQPSVLKGSGFYGARYSFTGSRGTVVTIEVDSQDFDADLNLTDPNGFVVAENDVSLSVGLGIRPAIVYTLRTNGTYVFEVTSANQFVTGNFTASVDCASSPELDVFFGSTNVINGTAYDLGLVATGSTIQLTFLLTNSGSATLNFSSITLTPTNLFTNSSITITSLATNSATNFTVYYRALSNGPWTGTLTLNNSDDFDDTTDGYEFDDPFIITFTAFVNPPGVAPTVTITNLSNGQVLTTPPTLTIGVTTTVTNTHSVTQILFRATGPAGVVPIGIDTTSPWQVNWSNAPGGSYSVQATAMDSAGRMGLSATKTITVNNRPVTVKDRFSVFTDSTNNFLDVLANDTDADGHALTITNSLLTGPSHGFATVSGGGVLYAPSSSYTGNDSFSYVIYDSLGATNIGVVTVAVFSQFGWGADPVSLITAPSNNVEIIEPVAINGTASHEFLQFWELQYRRRGSSPTPWKTFAEGTDAVTNSFLATFDTTGLPNGIYEIKLKVVAWTDVAATTSITIRIGESPKIGHFTLAFTDLQIPVSGLPITLTRSYDSRNTDLGDFGAGWNLDVSSVRLEKSGVMGEGWTSQIGSGFAALTHCIQEVDPHVVTITFPGDKVFRFYPQMDVNGGGDPCEVSGGLGQAFAAMNFAALPGTVGTLRALTPNPARLRVGFLDVGQPVTFHEDRDDPLAQSLFGPVYDPQEFEFTTLDGRKFQFNAAGKVVKMWDRVGNSLTFGSTGIIHSSGKSVKFLRDAAGRITEIYDPNGLDTNGLPNGPAALQYKYDAAGNLVSVHRLTTRNAANPKYVTTQFGYEHSKYPHYITSIIDPRGVTGIRNEYDDDGRLKSMTDASGKTIQYVHSLSNRTEIIIDRLGFTNVFNYDSKGNVTNSVNALGHVNTYVFDANNNKTREIIAGVLTNAFNFDANNLLTESVVGGLITNKFTYNKFGQVHAALDGLGRGTTNFFDAIGNLLATTNALGFTNGFTYDAVGNLLTLKDALGVLTSHLYDQYGNLTNAVTGSAAPSAFSYDDNGNRLAEVQLAPSTLTPLTTNTFLYDAQNRVIARVDSLGNTNRTEFNALGRHEEVIDALGRTNRYEYDLRGNLSLVTYPDQTTEQYAYDAEGRRTNSVDRAGRNTGFVFDALGRLTQTTYPDNTSTRTIFDPVGRVQFTVDARGATNAFGFDLAGRRIAVTNAWATSVAQWSTNAFDAGGNLIATGDALGRVTRYTYDALNRRTQTTLPDNTTQTTLYNGAGQRVGEVDQAGLTNRFGYHLSLGTLQAVTNAWATPSATWATYAFDPLGRQTNQVDALGRKTAYEFDADGRRQRRLLPGTQSEGFTYDAAGNLLRQTNFNGQIITNLYDSQSRLLSHWHGSTQLVAFTYNFVGLRATMSNEVGVTTFAYDIRDRLITNASPVGTLVHGYDANGNLTNLVSSTVNGVSIGYQYDALNQLTNVVDNRLTSTKNTAYTFDGIGNLTALNYPNGVTNQWQYDALNRVTNLVWKLNATTNAAFAYQMGAAGNRTRLDETVNGSNRVYQWSYDNLYRLKNEIITGAGATGTVAYLFDAVGNRTNRTSSITGITNQAFSYNTNDWLGIDTYDSAGNTRTNSGNIFFYDWANRLTNAVIGTTNVSIVYNGDGHRVKKTVIVGTTTNITLYLVGDRNPTGYAQVSEEKTVVGTTTNLVKAFVYGHDLISQRVPGVTTNFYGYDGIGSTRFLLNLSGAVSDTYAFDAFGTIIARTGNTTNENLFHGEWRDTLLGLDYRPARYYSPNIGRWWTMDPWEGNTDNPVSLHKYVGYANDSQNRVDPSGNEGISATISSVSIQYNFGPYTAKELTRQVAANDSIAKRRAQYKQYHFQLNGNNSPAGAIRSRWFEAAAIVTGANGVGAAEIGFSRWLGYLDREAQRYLEDVNEYLFVWNTANFIKLSQGEEIPGFEGKRSKVLDKGLVRFEQQKIEEFSSSYFANKPAGLKGKITPQLNKVLYSEFAPGTVRASLHSRFIGIGKAFGFDSVTDRIRLGEGIIDAIYERPIEIFY